MQQVRVRRAGESYRWWSAQRGRPVEAGGYLWAGELRLWDGALTGWYKADDGAVRSLGSVYFVLHAHGQRMTGRWVGRSWDGENVSGFGVMARTRVAANAVARELIEKEKRGTDR